MATRKRTPKPPSLTCMAVKKGQEDKTKPIEIFEPKNPIKTVEGKAIEKRGMGSWTFFCFSI